MKNKKILIIVIAAAVVLVGVMLLLIFLPKGGADNSDTGAATLDEAKITASTDANGVHLAVVGRKGNGEIEQNGSGKLMEYFPADISRIHLENTKGTLDVLSNTPKGEATVYTVEGYEKYDLQSGIADLIASACASLEFSTVAGRDDGKNSAGFGFDSPRATVTVTYNDKTKSLITVGDDAPQQAGTYVKFGGGDDVFVVDAETAKAFDYGLTDLMSKTVNSAADNTDNNQAQSIELWGTNFSDDITLVPNDSVKVSASYRLTSPVECYANEHESSLVAGGIRGLFADSVVMVNPSQTQLVNLGLAEPAAKLRAVYPDATVELSASNPDPNGKVNLMVSGRDIVYSVPADKVAWVGTSYEKLVSEYALYPKLTALSKFSVTTGGKEYSFDLSSKTTLTTDSEGSETETTTTVVYYDGKEIQTENFYPLYEAASLIELADAKTGNPSGDPEMKIEYTYADDGSTDTVEFYPAADNRCLAVLNGRAEGHSRNSDISRVAGAINEALK